MAPDQALCKWELLKDFPFGSWKIEKEEKRSPEWTNYFRDKDLDRLVVLENTRCKQSDFKVLPQFTLSQGKDSLIVLQLLELTFKIQEKMWIVFNFPGKDLKKITHPSKPSKCNKITNSYTRKLRILQLRAWHSLHHILNILASSGWWETF